MIVLGIVAVAVSSGCAPRQSRDQYQDRLTGAVSTRLSVSDALSKQAYTTKEQYEAAAQRVATAKHQLDTDQPPRGLSDAHQSMLDGLEGLQALLSRLGRCAALADHAEQDARACRQSISQGVYDEIRNDFTEADTIYRHEGFSLPTTGDGGASKGTIDRGDVIDEATESTEG